MLVTIEIDKIICDLSSRINPDVDGLVKSIKAIGLTEPLSVAGPDNKGFYYLIKGYRRYKALSILSKNETQYNKIKVNVVKDIVEPLEVREAIRFHLHNTTKKVIGNEEQKAIDNVQVMGRYSDEEVLQKLQPKNSRIKRMEKSRKIDKSLREEVSKKRASQHALEVIQEMNICDFENKRLYGLLIDKKLTGMDADALMKLNNDELFINLSDNQKTSVINQTLQQSRFTKREAHLIILSELMKSTPKEYTDHSYHWVNYISTALESVIDFIHPDLNDHTNEFQRGRLRQSLSHLNNKLDWTWNKPYKHTASKSENKEEFTEEITDKGFKFRIHHH